MGFTGTGKIWMNGSLVDWQDATIHVASHVIHYGSGVFEGIRCYDTPRGSAVFRLDAHMRRLVDSAKIYRMEYRFGQAALEAATLETIRANGLAACYIRPIIYRGYEALGINPFPCPVEGAILVWEWGAYLGNDAHEKGVDVCVSSWHRIAPNTFPALAKATANYANAQLIKMEAMADDYSEGVALDVHGHVSEGSGQNVFLVRNGVVFTPHASDGILPGITRDTILTLARDLGYEVREAHIQREALYIADELFLVGTAVEVTPVRSVDRIPIGNGAVGPITRRIQQAYFAVVKGEAPDTRGWLTYVPRGGEVAVPATAATAPGR